MKPQPATPHSPERPELPHDGSRKSWSNLRDATASRRRQETAAKPGSRRDCVQPRTAAPENANECPPPPTARCRRESRPAKSSVLAWHRLRREHGHAFYKCTGGSGGL